MWFELEKIDLSFADRAPFKFENEAIINASATRVFEITSAGEGEKVWLKDFKSAHWISQPPHGVDSRRELSLTMLTMREHFVAWEPGRRVGVHVEAITLPVVKAMLQDMQIEPMGDERCRIRWRAYYTPSFLMRLVHPIGRAIFGQIFSASTAALVKYASENPGPLKVAEKTTSS